MVEPFTPSDTKDHFDVDYDFIAHLNGECIDWAGMDSEALQQAMRAQGDAWYGLVQERCPHLFAAAPVFVSELQLQQMRDVIKAVGDAVNRLDAQPNTPHPNPDGTTSHSTKPASGQVAGYLPPEGEGTNAAPASRDVCHGVFYGYDFHLNEQGAHLIEVNTNAGGGFLNALLIDSQRAARLYGAAVAQENLEQVFVGMFRNEWRLERGDVPLKTVAIVDEQPESQYLFPEFLLAKAMLERAGIAVHIADPAALEARVDGLYCNGRRIDLIYNRLTDFDLHRHPHVRSAWEKRHLVLTPNPKHYQKYADKRKLVALTEGITLLEGGTSQDDVFVLLKGIPQTRIVDSAVAGQWWVDRKQWFFKPVSGYGGKGAYRGEKLTKRVFEEILQSEYVAQRLAVPGERKVCMQGSEPQSLKFDVRCYVYDGDIQLVAARLYQGQTTNFRTPGGGFALVRVVN